MQLGLRSGVTLAACVLSVALGTRGFRGCSSAIVVRGRRGVDVIENGIQTTVAIDNSHRKLFRTRCIRERH
jgi:hypothetical protein